MGPMAELIRKEKTFTFSNVSWLLIGAIAVLTGCAGPAIRNQSPEVEALLNIEAETRLVGDYVIPWGMNSQRIERAALVTGLAGTGSDPPPNACLLYTSPSPRDKRQSRMPSSA